jgi:hypothetical protein
MTAASSRRWFFSVLTLLVVATAFGIWLRWEFKIVHERATARQRIEADGGLLSVTRYRTKTLNRPVEPSELSFVRILLGDEAVGTIFVRAASDDDLADASYFPEADIRVLPLQIATATAKP